MTQRNSEFVAPDLLTDVLDVKKSDKILQIGGIPFSFLNKYVRDEVTFEPDCFGLSSEFIRHRFFDKIIVVAKCVDELAQHIEKIVSMNLGGIVLFVFDERPLDEFTDVIEAWWWPSTAWSFGSNGKHCVMTDAGGPTTFVYCDEEEC